MTVVVGYVPDATGFLAITEAVQQARFRQTDVVIVNVVDESGFVKPTAADEQDLDAVARRLTEDGVRFSVRHVNQDRRFASDEILKAADEVEAELIVVGLQRRSPVGKALLGSNAQRILLGATCPVLAVRAPEDQ
ncbi:universal stress protein [Jatrophihabitans sp. YIM 134969]